jgi:hypothetical protein
MKQNGKAEHGVLLREQDFGDARPMRREELLLDAANGQNRPPQGESGPFGTNGVAPLGGAGLGTLRDGPRGWHTRGTACSRAIHCAGSGVRHQGSAPSAAPQSRRRAELAGRLQWEPPNSAMHPTRTDLARAENPQLIGTRGTLLE